MKLHSEADHRQVLKHFDAEGNPCADIILPMKGDPDLDISVEEFKLLMTSMEFRYHHREGIYKIDGTWPKGHD